jgi:hypothetical protein
MSMGLNRRDDLLRVIEKVERGTGIEPATSSLGSWHSTAELPPHVEGTATSLKYPDLMRSPTRS